MYVELHDGLHKPIQAQATRVVIYDDYDNPIAVAVQIENGHYVVSTATQKQFQSILKAMGITKTLVIAHVDTDKIPPLI